MENNLPKNWVETDLDTIIVRMTNGSSLKQLEDPFKGSLPISRIETIWNETIDLDRVKYVDASEDDIKKYGLQKGDVLFSHINSDKHLGKTAIFNLDETVIHGINLLLLRAMPQFNGDLLNYILRHYRFSGKFIEVAQRSVNQSSINQKKLKSFIVPLPPLAEQQRIVAKLDELFGHLDSLKKRLENIPTLLKNLKQAILTQAVTGKLTQEWRVGKQLEEWKIYSIDEVSETISGFAFKSKEFVNEGIQLIRMGNLYNNKLDLSRNPVYLPTDIDPKLIEKYSLKVNDILLSLTGTKYKRDYGFAIKIENTSKLLLNQRILALRPKIEINYFLYLLRGENFRNQFFATETGGVNQGNVGTRAVKAIKVNIPPKEEQIEIVKSVENLFTKVDKIEAQYQSLKTKIDSLPQAILAKAFRGELVEQLDTDGDAKELLAEIQALKESLAKKPKAKRSVKKKK